MAALSQHLVREDRQFALAMAGLPTAVSNLLSDHVLTFLRRADRHDLRSLAIDDVEDALRHRRGQRQVDRRGGMRCAAAEATAGYPFMVQLVGYQMWRAGGGPASHRRRRRAGRRGPGAGCGSSSTRRHSTTCPRSTGSSWWRWRVDDGPSRVADIARRIGRSSQYANTYRGRLMAAGVIESPSRGRVDLSIPYLRDTLRTLGDLSRPW